MSKGLREPGDKLQLLKVLSLGQVIEALESKTRAQQIERGSDVDEGEESYREALGKLLNIFGLELMKLIDVRCFVFRIRFVFVKFVCRTLRGRTCVPKRPYT